MFYRVRYSRKDGMRCYIIARGYHDAVRLRRQFKGKIIGGGKRKF